eukprot:CAMPEP_0117659730 /NCGR_PEP_ID=MMETSP0804-20121206/6588_1 /TAXON_ID=1074897 /ORGANISM="Tetraselmis astigmatica, Strain CCMP880" /LENGTH=354 /DNA_ID=CAMNT_0005466407 /DNA_START=340 /DNA_END=1401 /DNA_ORIENTATION=+
MAQAVPLSELEAGITEDFSGQLRFQHGLQPDACGYASHALCELKEAEGPGSSRPLLQQLLGPAATPGQRLVVHTVFSPSPVLATTTAYDCHAAAKRSGKRVDHPLHPSSPTGPLEANPPDAVSLADFLAELSEDGECDLDIMALEPGVQPVDGCTPYASSPSNMPARSPPAAADILAAVHSLWPEAPLLISDSSGLYPSHPSDLASLDDNPSTGPALPSGPFSRAGRGLATALREALLQHGGDHWVGWAALLPVLAAVWSPISQRLHLLHPAAPHSLANLLRFSPHSIGSDERLRLLLHQLLSSLALLHGAGLPHGRIHAGNLLLAPDGGLWLAGGVVSASAPPMYQIPSSAAL